jgi:hypothetical protein
MNSRIFNMNEQNDKNIKNSEFTSEGNLNQLTENIESSFS